MLTVISIWPSAPTVRWTHTKKCNSSWTWPKSPARPVDLVDLFTVGEPLLGQIIAGGRRILGDDERHALLLSRRLLNQADFMPYRNRILREWRQTWIGR